MKKNQYLWLLVFLTAFLGLFLFNSAQAATEPSISINSNNYSVKIRKVTLYIYAPTDARQMKISNAVDFAGADWEPYQTSKTWYLDYGAGAKTVYVRFKDKKGKISDIYKDIIQLDPPAEMAVEFKINNGDVETDSRYVQLAIKYSAGVESMIVGNTNDFTGLNFEEARSSTAWALTKESGEKIVYIQFKDAGGKIKTISQKIKYQQPENYIEEGTLLKGQSNAVYYLGDDGKLHPFSSAFVFHSWYSDFKDVRYVGNSKLKLYEIGNSMCVRPGAWLVKFVGLPTVYAVEPGCRLRPLLSEANAFLLYGASWNKRILELNQVEGSQYQIRGYSVADKEKGIVDKDGDGVEQAVEEEYGASDKKADSDGDGLTDYEEIFYWFSDPALIDTDGDGYKDGTEASSGYNPAGGGKLTEVSEGTYEYPYGSVFAAGNGNYYYSNPDDYFYYIGSAKDQRLLRTNNFSADFIIKPPLLVVFPYSNNRKVKEKEEKIIYPLILSGERLMRL